MGTPAVACTSACWGSGSDIGAQDPMSMLANLASVLAYLASGLVDPGAGKLKNRLIGGLLPFFIHIRRWAWYNIRLH